MPPTEARRWRRVAWLSVASLGALVLVYVSRHWISAEYQRLREKGVPFGATVGLVVGSFLIAGLTSLRAATTSAFAVLGRFYRAARMRRWLSRFIRIGEWLLGELRDFGVALLPLALPLYVAFWFGSASLPFWGAAIVGLPAMLLVLGLVTQLKDASLKRAARGIWEWIPGAFTVLILLAGIGYFVLLAAGWLHYVDKIGGMPTLLAAIAAFILLVAFVLRLFGFAVNLVRLVVALFTVGCVVYYMAKGGLAPGWSFVHSFTSPLGWTEGGISLVVLAAILRALQRAAGLRQTRQDYIFQVGALAAFVSAVVFAMSFGWSVLFDRSEPNHIDSFGGSVTPGTPAPGFLALHDQNLAEMFVPILQLTPNERWQPSDVNHYVGRASLLTYRGKPTNRIMQDEYDLPRTCPRGVRFPCWILNCPKCASDQPSPPTRASFEGETYVHVIRRTGKDAQPEVFASADRFAPGLSAILQYWLFYEYDRWETTSPLGKFTQEHSGDWEQVTVGLSDKAPLFVAYSSHCGGHRYAWHDVEAGVVTRHADGTWSVGRETPNEPALHPLVGVATGSHANYAHPLTGRAPDWTSCRPNVASGAVLVLSYAANLRDTTGYSADVVPRVVVAHLNKPPMTFQGNWGLRDQTTLRNLRHLPLDHGSGPDTPSHKPMWRCPIEVLFESPGWQGTGDVNCPNRRVH